MNSNNKSVFPWHVFLFAVYSPLALLAHNLGQVDSSVAIRALLISLGSVLVLFFLLWWLLKNFQKAGLVLVFLEVLFFSYGHIYASIKAIEFAGFSIGRHRYLAVLWLGVALLGVWWILKKLRSTEFTGTLNLVVFLLVLFPLIEIISFESKSNAYKQAHSVESQPNIMSVSNSTADTIPVADNLPDIYYIILDAYGRSDVLEKNFDYDNSTFLEDLENLGFYVVECGQSNYANTDLSLASTLNLDYIDVLNDSLTPEITDRAPLQNLIRHNLVAEKFRNMGYKIRTFETEFTLSEIEPVDSFYVAPQKGFNGFESLLLETTAIKFLENMDAFQRLLFTADNQKYNRILFTFDTLEEIPQLPGPNFVFLHLLLPHQRFVFGPDGEMAIIQKTSSNKSEYYSDEEYISGYKNQAIFVSQRITKIAEGLIENSSTPPIIILQGDHGPSHFSASDRMGILNAYYFPDVQPEFYSTITPVNTFRLLFNTYFEEDYPLLDDMSYHSTYQVPYQFTEVSNECSQ